MAPKSALAAALLLSIATAQQIGTAIPEVHPKLTTQRCTLADGCKPVTNAVVLDSGARNNHKVGDEKTPCNVGSDICSDAETCAKNCVLEGIPSYEAQGVKTDGDVLTLNQFMPNDDGTTRVVTPRIYLLDSEEKNYEAMKLLNAEFTFDVDVSKLVCGMNGALYMGEMSNSGGRSELNPAGAQYGTGYCDAQCPTLPWIDGLANVNNTFGSCCNEFDIWEANSRAQTFTPHPCTEEGVFKCLGEEECGLDNGVCDKWGTGYNPYSYGFKDYYGLNKTVDTNKKFTVVTQFLTDDKTAQGTLNEIRRLYVQDGKVIQNQVVTAGGKEHDSINNEYVNSTSAWTEKRGGLARMGGAIDRGMTLTFSIWADNGGFMKWLDSGNAGPCNETEGDPKLIQRDNPDAAVIFSNMKWGEIGSTYKPATCVKRRRA